RSLGRRLPRRRLPRPRRVRRSAQGRRVAVSPRAVLRRVVVGVLDTNCWILHADGDRRALVVDPGDEPDRILAASADLDVVAVLLTHAHFDHVLAVAELVETLRVP